MRSRQSRYLANEVNQQEALVNRLLVDFAVNRYAYAPFHADLSSQSKHANSFIYFEVGAYSPARTPA